MKKLTLIIMMLLLPALALADHEFGLRLNLGTDSVADTSNTEFGANMDFIVWQDVFMQMGATFLLNDSGNVDVAINYLGLEYNYPLGRDCAIAGLGYNRSYIKGTSGGGVKELSYHLGYKMCWLNWVDLIMLAGVMPQKLLTSAPNTVSGGGAFFRTAVELYY
ncbi:MAG: hypothetical protein JW782_06095 [Candidatus Saganbacteria bacterium]|nr:hypothetical protein [Candidatus Saganbacteria bacterium]